VTFLARQATGHTRKVSDLFIFLDFSILVMTLDADAPSSTRPITFSCHHLDTTRLPLDSQLYRIEIALTSKGNGYRSRSLVGRKTPGRR
jgi:hypothetical protein